MTKGVNESARRAAYRHLDGCRVESSRRLGGDEVVGGGEWLSTRILVWQACGRKALALACGAERKVWLES